MMHTSLRSHYLMGTVVVAFLAITASGGLFVEGLYRPFVQSDALLAGLPVQDFVSLLTAPLLLAAMVFTARGSRRAFVAWVGLLVYVAYYYAFYVFGFMYTAFYPLYLALVALSTFSFVGLLAGADAEAFREHASERMPVRFIGAVLATPVLLVPLWVSMIFKGIAAQQAGEIDLVFVLDLGFLIPAVLFTGVQIWRRRAVGYLLGGVLLVKSAISGVLLTAGSLWGLYLGFPAGADIVMYLFLAVAGSWALVLYMRNLQDEPRPEARSRALRPASS
ncbi:MAG TPA: hypothetical protein VF707_07465 [Ardenticatenaceae bacterium]|jgi:hypothetical protein